MKKTDYSANGKRAMSLGITWKALLAVAAFGLAFGSGCGKKSDSGEDLSAKELSSMATKVETKTFSLPGGVGLEMIHIECGAHGFWLGKYEVTQGQWDAVMGSNPAQFWGENLPVSNVSWNDCQEFVKRLNALPEVKESGLAYRLPTEKEWECACRAGTKGDYCKLEDGTEITVGTLSEVAWYGAANGKAHPVGQKKPNAFGFNDMHGNVMEWCQDLDQASGLRVNRGGGNWASDRGGASPDERRSGFGLRLAASQVGSSVNGSPSAAPTAGNWSSPESKVETKTFTIAGGMKLDLAHIKCGTHGFWLGKCEVTQGLWEAVMGNNPARFKGVDLPVEKVSWHDCQGFIKKLNALPEVKESGLTYRLPTAEEWGYACLAGSTGDYCKLEDGTDITKETLSEVAWHFRNSKGTTHPVGQKKPNAFGFYDMNGNVEEWCQNLDPANGSSDRACCGGGLNNYFADCYTAFSRGHVRPDDRHEGLGFRLAASQDVKR